LHVLRVGNNKLQTIRTEFCDPYIKFDMTTLKLGDSRFDTL